MPARDIDLFQTREDEARMLLLHHDYDRRTALLPHRSKAVKLNLPKQTWQEIELQAEAAGEPLGATIAVIISLGIGNLPGQYFNPEEVSQ